MEHRVTILMIEFVTHDVKRFVVTRPRGFEFQPGQAVEVAINQTEWLGKRRPFSPTSLLDDWVLEFTIKCYPDHRGVTEKLHNLRPGDELLLSEPFGSITYNGPGLFIAGGAGITPLMAIIRTLARERRLGNNGLLFSNKTPADIICGQEFRHYLGDRCRFLCTREPAPGCESARIDKLFLQSHIDDFKQHFYVCGPGPFVKAINTALQELGASSESLVFER